ncbi:DUF3667 domain-containing protein [Mucilaginibacter corticis]|uniref:DUF3667 domain-containing protein n=1 Tax=Mucilaginibacter corticis TaxID=2597670 RepID=A0A556MHQ9_9SPHI|nr:DUF3667 domain-containing protein [Mucilaginibacter corticis]TSJ39446.1 DUF3667 domain-containing protein [Mucilaginibacter corticis]
MKKHYRKENDCLNCGAELKGKFCYVCGQENLQIKESFGHMMNHAISDYFHFDHQFFHTLKPLLFKPGKLTNEYMAGRRVQYLHPVKMYIFISLVYFVLLFQSGFEPVKIKDGNDGKVKGKKALIATNKELDSISKDPNTPDIAKGIISKVKTKVDSNLSKIDTTDKDDDDDENTVSANHQKTHYSIFGDDVDDPKRKNDTTYELYLNSQQKLPADQRDGFFHRLIRKREYELNANAKEVKANLVEGLKHNTPKMMFLLLPLFALLLRITFWKNKKFYVEHLIYSFHLHCFIFLFLAIMMLLKMATPAAWHGVTTWLDLASTLIIIWYIYTSLRAVYHRSSGRTISKMIGLSFSYLVVFSFCMLSLVIIVALFD